MGQQLHVPIRPGGRELVAALHHHHILRTAPLQASPPSSSTQMHSDPHSHTHTQTHTHTVCSHSCRHAGGPAQARKLTKVLLRGATVINKCSVNLAVQRDAEM